MSLIPLQHTTQSTIPLAGFKPAIPAVEQPQTLVLDRAATGTGRLEFRTVQTVASRFID
jgi:hypothetical protein